MTDQTQDPKKQNTGDDKAKKTYASKGMPQGGTPGAQQQTGGPVPPPPPPQGAGPVGGSPMPPQGGPVGGLPVPPPPPAYPPQGGYYPPQGGGYPPQGYYPPQGGGYPPQGGYYPPYPHSPYGQPGMYPPPPGGGYPPMPGTGPGAGEPEDMTPANFQLGTKFPKQLKVKCPPHGLKFDEEKFVRLLAGSISLSKDEKKKIVESVPKLKQEQIDELIRIFEEEKQKFAALSKKHVPQLEKLAEQHYHEWMELEQETEQTQRKQQDQQKADEIRKNLGL